MACSAYLAAIKDMTANDMTILINSDVDPMKGNYHYLNRILGIRNGNQGKVTRSATYPHVVTDEFGNKWITKENYPNLVDQWNKFINWAYWNSCCIDEALDWCNCHQGNAFLVSDFNSDYVQSRMAEWHNQGCPVIQI